MRRRVVLISLTTLVSLVFALGAVEMLTRLAGWNMWRAPVLDRNLPVLHEPDPILGWRNRPGSVVWPGLWSDRGRDIVMTFWQDGLRATAPERRPRRAEVPLVGCSYTQGWAVTDSETYAWQLQTMLPRVTVLNYGTAGYGTYQSLLALERHFARAPGPVPLVVYGLIESHEDRNVAPASWLRGLTTVSHGGPLAVPFVTIGSAGTLERHAPQSYPSWPLDRRLASVDLLEFAWASFESRGRLEQSVPVLEALLLEMQRVAHAHGAELVVVILDARSRGWLPRRTRFLRAHSISTVSCVHPRITSQQVPGYGHPDRVWHAYVATCLAAHLRPLIASRLRPE